MEKSKLGGCYNIICYTEKVQAESRLEEITEKWESLKFTVFDLEEKIKEYVDDRSRLACEMSQLREQHHDDCARMIKLEEKMKELQEERDGYKNGQIQLQGMVDDLMDVNGKWAERVKGLELDLTCLNYSRDTEKKLLTELPENSESRFKRLQEAVDRHKLFTYSIGGHCSPEEEVADQELYKVRDEI